jgi:hypothetical protein
MSASLSTPRHGHPFQDAVGRAYTVACLAAGVVSLAVGKVTMAAILLLGVLLHWVAVRAQR